MVSWGVSLDLFGYPSGFIPLVRVPVVVYDPLLGMV